MKQTIKEYRKYISDLEKGNVELLDEFINFHQVQEIYRVDNVGNIIKNQNRRGKYIMDRPPHDDHGRMFKTKDGCFIYVYHCYFSKDEIEQEIMEWCLKNDIAYTISPKCKSWYYPENNGTSMVIIHKIGYKVD